MTRRLHSAVPTSETPGADCKDRTFNEGSIPSIESLRSTTGGIYEVSISDRKCIPLIRDVDGYHAKFARDGKSFLYAGASRGEVSIYRQGWSGGKLIGAAQIVLKAPFAFPLFLRGNAYAFSRDLSTIVYARQGGHADLYLLSQK